MACRGWTVWVSASVMSKSLHEAAVDGHDEIDAYIMPHVRQCAEARVNHDSRLKDGVGCLRHACCTWRISCLGGRSRRDAMISRRRWLQAAALSRASVPGHCSHDDTSVWI